MKKKILKFAELCLQQNKIVVEKKLSIQNFGNVSLRIDDNHFVIKPSGVNLYKIKVTDIPVVNIKNGKKILGKLKPSSDTETHLEIYKKYKNIKSITHTHSTYATGWAQTGKSIPLLGTTHADFWEKDVPNVKFLTKNKVVNDYEKNTGKIIIESLNKLKLNAYNCSGVLVMGHGPFVWSDKIDGSIKNAEALEFIAKLAFISNQLKIKKKLPRYISNKHYQRKHGKKSYYGQ
tara:strand:+ start:814 stop:1512 length:699 start_codon:yes stop_codon:yes gene_type:complete